MSTQAKPEQQQQQPPRSRPGEPTWEVTEFFPRQGEWSESEYLALETNRLVEYKDGCLELLPMPSGLHQAIVLLLCERLRQFVRESQRGATVLAAPIPVYVTAGSYREPDIVVVNEAMSSAQLADFQFVPAEKVLLAIEVVSPSNRKHDRVTKREEYAAAGIPEYWIVEPEAPRIERLVLDNASYTETAFGPSETVMSMSLEGFSIPVDALSKPT